MTDTLERPVRAPSRRARVSPGRLALVGSFSAFASAAFIWMCRVAEPSVHYVSQLGATGMPTAPLFNLALLLLAVAAVLVDRAAVAHGDGYVVGWPVATTLLACGMCFAVASVITCSPGCPVPFTPGALPQDLVHISFAVLGFGLAIVAMGQVAALRRRPWMRAASVVTLVAVGSTSLTGAMIALFRGDTVLGGNFEFTAATLAISWFGVFGLHVAADHRAAGRRDASTR
ncbi:MULTISPECIES: DUF998 domain-containing protein [Microbacterium]|uniref:DUF998 domain-containing protein n=1 Tax=Microbacterium TaxID=33882 RepID=UPI00278B053E|nr:MULTISPECIES: DUF998 domain-containing protein [Microbacterium]MDQ1082996.1 putative membrane protein [Microbacterium sp. SORGH_AS_0344]MDQ1168237.1 putative membrane protein [Microbacterium proteolyticum]